MNPLAKFLQPRTFWIGGVCIGSVSVLLVAKMLGWSLILALLIVLAIVLIGVIVMLVMQLQKNAKRAETIEKTIGHQADRDIERSVPGQVQQMQNLKADLLAAIEALKKTRSGKAGEGVLSTLPWYLLMGPSGTGKSEMMARSGLHFPLLDAARRGRAVKGVGGTRSFDWWLSQEAVVLDMGGRTLTASAQFEDNDDWFAFLDVLKQQRPRKPLNGVVVSMPLDQLADRPDAQIDKLAGGVRERIAELVQRLGVVFPVYVVFTKADLLSGFAEFFSELSTTERAQPWGATIATSRATDQAAEELFDEEMTPLLASLSDRRMQRIGGIPDAFQRARTFAFPAQLERIRPAMRRFIQNVFAPDPTQSDAALFRGFYLVSATQEGSPVDRVLEPEARAMRVALAPVAPPQTSGAFFVHQLLTRVIFADQHLASVSRRALEAMKRRRLFMLGGLGVLFLASLIVMLICAGSNAGLAKGTVRAARDVANNMSESSTLMDKLRPLEALRARLSELEKNKRWTPWWRALGGYSANALIEPGVRLYSDRALETLMKPSVELMKQRTDALTANWSGEFRDFYFVFRSWRLLMNPSQMSPDDSTLVARGVRTVLAQDVLSVAPDQRAEVPGLLARQVAFLAAHHDGLEGPRSKYFPLDDPNLVARGKVTLREHWDPGSFYRLLVDEQGPGLKPMTLPTLVPNLSSLTSAASIPGLYTKDGWTDRVKPEIERWRESSRRDAITPEAFSGSAPDLAAQVTELYAKDYAAQWSGFLEGIALDRPATDLRGVAVMLQTFMQNDSPVLKVVQAVSRQTMMGVESKVGLDAVRDDFQLIHSFFQAPSAEKASFLDKVGKSAQQVGSKLGLGKPSAKLDFRQALSGQYLQVLSKAYEEVNAAADKGMSKEALSSLPAVAAADGWVDEASAAYATAAGTPGTVALLKLPIKTAMGGMNDAIRNQITNDFTVGAGAYFDENLRGKYPIDASSTDVNAFRFNEYYKEGGEFWKFYEEKLKPYVTPSGAPQPDQEPGAVPENVMRQLQLAYRIRQAFYTSDPSAAKFTFTVKTSQDRFQRPAGLNTPFVSFDVGGKFARYNMGPPSPLPLEWPGAQATDGANLRVQVSGQADAIATPMPGVWGLFHLVDRAQVSKVSDNVVMAAFRVPLAGGASMSIPYELQTESLSPFTRDFWSH